MKKIALLLLVCVSMSTLSFADDTETINFKKLEKFKLDQIQLKVMTKKSLSIYDIKNGYAYAPKGYVFYSAKNAEGGQLVIVLNSNPKANPSFVKVSKNELSFEIAFSGEVMIYCSCGLNIIESVGDNCRQFQVASNGVNCGGGCTEGNQGSSCSYTSFDTMTGIVSTPGE